MKHTNAKRLSLALLPLLAMAALAACAPAASDGGGSDPTKAHLSIGTLDAGIGGKWIEEAAARFEKLYQDSTDFEEGKVGVSISVSARRTYDGTFLLNQNWNQDIMFTEAINYYAMANSGKIRDITDLMNADLSAYGDPAGTTILSKVDPSFSSFLDKEGKYYGIPFYESFYGFVYDVDLWKQDGLYFQDGGGFTKDESKFAAGPDGVKGTYDDGMPATYADFSILMNRLATDYGRAFVISTDEHEYMANLLFNFWANEEGYDGMNLQYKLSSEEAGGKRGDQPDSKLRRRLRLRLLPRDDDHPRQRLSAAAQPSQI